MADSLTVPSVALSGTASIPPVAFQLLTSTASTTDSTFFTSSPSLVELSSTGQLLSAVFAFRSELEALPPTTATSSPAALVATAQGLVDAVNELQTNTTSLDAIFGALAGNTSTTQLALTLNELATTTIADATINLGSLQGIGIELQTTDGQPTLLIDQNQLLAAINADPAATQAALADATQSLIDLADTFEAQVASAAASLTNLTPLTTPTGQTVDLNPLLDLPTNSTVQGIGIPTDLLQNLSADTLANAIPLADLDLAAAGADADILLATPAVIREPLVADLLTPAVPPALVGEQAADSTLGLLGAVTPPATLASATPNTGAPASAAEPVPAIPVITPPATTVATATPAALDGGVDSAADALAADRRARAATIALQNLLDDPSQQAIANHFDPAYSALIAASHMADFVPPDPAAINLKTILSDELTPVLPSPTARALSYYNEVAGETWKQFTPNWERLQWFA